jgi:Uma2 family endonuclease
MSTVTPTQPMSSPAPLASPVVYRMSVDEFERIADSLDDERVELLDGLIVRREEMKPLDVLVTERLRRQLDRRLPADWFVREDKPIRIPDFNEPLPDLAVVRGQPEVYFHRHPGPEDVAVVIEVSDSSLGRDQGEKWISYSRCGIPVYWVVNLIDSKVELYTGPTPTGYAMRTDFRPGDDVPVVIAGTSVGTITVSDPS